MAGLSSLVNRFQFVKQIPIFNKLNWFEVQKIARKSRVVEFKKGETICSEGDPADYFYCLISGRLQAYSLDENDQKKNLDFIHRGMHFGIISILTGENHSLNFEAINDSVVLQILKDDFQAILKSIPQLGLEFSESLSKRIRRKVKGTQSVFESTIISIYSPVKGTGSSTYAANLALSLEKETKKKVILVSFLSQPDEEKQKGKKEDEAAPHWLKEAVHLNEILSDHEKITSSILKNDLSIDLINVVFDSEDASLRKEISPLVSALVGDYHYVIVDLPNEMDDVVLETLTQSDSVHLISSDRRRDLEQIRRVINGLEISLKEGFRVDKIRVIIRAVHEKVYLSFEEINHFIDFDVYTRLPLVPRSELIEHVKTDSVSFLRSDPKSEYSKTITRISREIGGVRVGVVLGGGAALGIAHIGVIRVLEEEGIPVDVVVGSSMGALIGSMWTVGKSSSELETIAREFEKKMTMLKLFDPVFPISGLIGGRAIKRWLKKHLGNGTFYSCKIPFKVVSYDLVRREEIVHNSGSLVNAVRESIAIPGVIEPIKHEGRVIIDGGVLNPLPTNVLAGLGIKKIIAVNVLQSPEDVSEGHDMQLYQQKKVASIPFWKNPFQFILFRFGRFFRNLIDPNISDIIVRTLQASEYVIAEQSAQQADVTIHPDLIGINWYELNRVDDLIKAGEDAAREHLPAIKALIEES